MSSIKSKLQSVFSHSKPKFLAVSPNIPTWPTFEPYQRHKAEGYRYGKHVGVNLGNLFVLEAWLSPPALKDAVRSGKWSSELDFLTRCQDNHQRARELLEQHWSTFITETDIATLASWGISAVRIPIGYWIVEPRTILADYPKDGFYVYADVYDAAMGYLMQLIHACEQHKIAVLIDIHGAPGGQNDDTHCGQLTIHSKRPPRLFTCSSHQDCYLAIVRRLTELLSSINNIIGIELLNEPSDDPSLPKLYERACNVIVNTTPPGQRPLPVYIGDCWNIDKYIDIIARQISSVHPFVVLDTHQYFCHGPEDHKLDAQKHAANVEGKQASLLQQGKAIRQNIVVGEWSMVLNDASMKGMNQRDTMSAFGNTQANVWGKVCAAHYYWTYKTSDDRWYWSMLYCKQQGLLPWLQPQQQSMIHSTDENELKDDLVKQELSTHLNYWKQQLANDPAAYAAIERHGWLYDRGFRRGYQVTLRFRQHGHRYIGFPSQLAKDYRLEEEWNDLQQQYDISAFGWAYEQGFVKAINTLSG